MFGMSVWASVGGIGIDQLTGDTLLAHVIWICYIDVLRVKRPAFKITFMHWRILSYSDLRDAMAKTSWAIDFRLARHPAASSSSSAHYFVNAKLSITDSVREENCK